VLHLNQIGGLDAQTRRWHGLPILLVSAVLNCGARVGLPQVVCSHTERSCRSRIMLARVHLRTYSRIFWQSTPVREASSIAGRTFDLIQESSTAVCSNLMCRFALIEHCCASPLRCEGTLLGLDPVFRGRPQVRLSYLPVPPSQMELGLAAILSSCRSAIWSATAKTIARFLISSFAC
jgi:hypothetical protein